MCWSDLTSIKLSWEMQIKTSSVYLVHFSMIIEKLEKNNSSFLRPIWPLCMYCDKQASGTQSHGSRGRVSTHIICLLECQVNPLRPLEDTWIDSISTQLLSHGPCSHPYDILNQGKVPHDVHMCPTLGSPALQQVSRRGMVIFPYKCFYSWGIKSSFSPPPLCTHKAST